jgi:competence protein ComEA
LAHNDRFLLAGCAAAVLLVAASGWLLIGSSNATALPSPDPLASSSAFAESSPATAQASGTELVVDVEGAVAEPGIVHLPAGSRVADALVAAGGYARDVDLAATARQLNLAATVADGDQVYVPRVGESAGGGSGASGTNGTSNGRINLNTASPEQLDSLPGVGPVTVQKIVAARQEQRFKSLDELVQRKVLTASQLAKIRDLATV